MTTARHLFAAALLGAALASSAHADPGVSMAWSYRDFTTWQLFGTATAQNDVPGNGFMYSNLVLTAPASHDAAGAGFAPGALALDFNQTFSFDFHFFIPASQDTRGDGLTFTLTDATGVGNGGSGLGYEGLSARSVALAIDTFHFDGEPVSPSLQLLSGGSVTPLAATATGLGDAIRGSTYQWYAALHYTPSGNGDNTGVLTGTLENLDHGSFSVSAAVDFDALGLVGVPVFYGFTAANGLATDGHFVTSAMPVPEPGRWALVLAGLGWLALLARRRSAA